MTREEMIAILAKSSGGTRTEPEIAAMLERPDPEEEKFCVCGEPLLTHIGGGNHGEHYDHMTNGY